MKPMFKPVLCFGGIHSSGLPNTRWRGFMEFGSISVDTELSVLKLVTSQDSWNVKTFSVFSFFMRFTFVCWAQSEWHTLNISWTPWTPLFISWQNYVLIAISVGDVGTSDPVVKARAILRNPFVCRSKLRWLQGWQGVLQRKDCLMV